MKLKSSKITELFNELKNINGGYSYGGIASSQICFPLKNGGELRFGIYDEDPKDTLIIDLYGGELPPMITGIGETTGKDTKWNNILKKD